uniref:Uncharacterized protein n=1 Tax=Anopheles farauti TaxID=69004 RepID=A0A182Q687_9DIPT
MLMDGVNLFVVQPVPGRENSLSASVGSNGPNRYHLDLVFHDHKYKNHRPSAQQLLDVDRDVSPRGGRNSDTNDRNSLDLWISRSRRVLKSQEEYDNSQTASLSEYFTLPGFLLRTFRDQQRRTP